jgi:N-methylhydantoinase A
VIALDIGGTTAKTSLVENGTPRITTQYKIEHRRDYAGYPILAPTIDIVEIGAGGGSIAWLDKAEAQSAPVLTPARRAMVGEVTSRRLPTPMSWRDASIRSIFWAVRFS